MTNALLALTLMVGPQVQPDLKVGSNPLGVIKAVSSNGVIEILRTNDGTKNNRCRVHLWGIKWPSNRAQCKRARQFIIERAVGHEVRFRIVERTKDKLVSDLLLTDLRSGAALNGWLVMQGYTATTLPNEDLFGRALAYAKKNRLGIWKK